MGISVIRKLFAYRKYLSGDGFMATCRSHRDTPCMLRILIAITHSKRIAGNNYLIVMFGQNFKLLIDSCRFPLPGNF